MGQTLFQIWMEKARRGKTPTEIMYFNPMKAKVGATITLDAPDLRGTLFRVTQIRVYERTIRGKTFTFTDYDIVGDSVKKRLRYYPQSEKTAIGSNYRIILLTIDEDHEYDKDEHDALKVDTGEFEIFGADEQLESRWWRVDDVRGAYHPLVVNINDVNGDGVVKDSEVSHSKIEYWDFSRQIESIGGNAVVEFLFIEIAEDTGWIQSWKGIEIAPDQVTCDGQIKL